MAAFSGTLNALKRGITKMSANAAIKNIENWEESLQDVEISGVKAILRDLGSLKKALDEDEPDGERIRHLMARLGSATIAISQKAEGRYTDKIEDLGHALAESAEQDDEDEGDSRTSSRSSGSRSSSSDREQGSSGRSRSSSSDHDMPERNSRGEFMSNSESDRGSSGRSSSSNGSSSRGSSGSNRSSSSSHHQGEVRDPEHDGRLKENRDRGVSMHANDRYDERSSSSRSSSSRSRYDDEDDMPSSRSSSSRSSGQGEVRDPEHDGRLKENRDRGVSKGSDERSSSSRSSSRSR